MTQHEQIPATELTLREQLRVANLATAAAERERDQARQDASAARADAFAARGRTDLMRRELELTREALQRSTREALDTATEALAAAPLMPRQRRDSIALGIYEQTCDALLTPPLELELTPDAEQAPADPQASSA